MATIHRNFSEDGSPSPGSGSGSFFSQSHVEVHRSVSSSSSSAFSCPGSPPLAGYREFEVILCKEHGVDLGVSVVRKTKGGISNIYVQDIAEKSPAHHNGRLRKGDRLLSVNGRAMQELTLLDAYQLFRGLQPGTVVVVAHREGELPLETKEDESKPDIPNLTEEQDNCSKEKETSAEEAAERKESGSNKENEGETTSTLKDIPSSPSL